VKETKKEQAAQSKTSSGSAMDEKKAKIAAILMEPIS